MKNLAGIYFSFFSYTVFSAPLFNIQETGTPVSLNAELCLNITGPISCEKHQISAANLIITSNTPNYLYSNAGLKIKTPGFALVGCEIFTNEYCVFSVSSQKSVNIVLSATDYELVTVADPRNSPDELTGMGEVDYIYKIGKYDVTIQQYTEFLNAVAKTDTYQLYNPEMALDLNSAGILQLGTPGNYDYRVMDNEGISANRPITYVNWFNAARFANWMSNGKPQGPQDSSTTENGAYELNGAISGIAVAKNSINPNTHLPPKYYLPTHNEWYKAAYYNPKLNGVGGYYLFATQSNVAPGNEIGKQWNQANYFIANGHGFSVTQSLFFVYTQQNYLTDVGSYQNSPSYYGTFDQNGNVDQWNDLDEVPSLIRGLRGGFYFSGSSPLKSNLIAKSAAINSYSGCGFRLASPSV